jgi:hypothetical protein
MSDQKEKLYTLKIENVYEILDKAQDEQEISRELLALYLSMENQNEYVSFLLSEVYWTNYSIVRILGREIETAVLTEQKEFVIMEDSLHILQSLTISKHAAALELKKLSVSIDKN